MKPKDSITLWKHRIINCKSSGQKVADWCAENDVSKHAYYYWHCKLNELETSTHGTSPIFAEVVKPEPSVDPPKKKEPEIVISWKRFTITINDQRTIPMVAQLLNSMEQESC